MYTSINPPMSGSTPRFSFPFFCAHVSPVIRFKLKEYLFFPFTRQLAMPSHVGSYFKYSSQVQSVGQSDDSDSQNAHIPESELLPEPNKTGKNALYTTHAVGRGIVAIAILSWWSCTLALRPAGYGWVAQTVITWFALFLIASSFVSLHKLTSSARRHIYIYHSVWFRAPYAARLALGWLIVVGVFMALVFGFKRKDNEVSSGGRAIPLLGVLVFQTILWLTSEDQSKIQWPRVVVALFSQQVIAMFVLKTRAGFDIFNWIVGAVVDFFSSDIPAQVFMWDQVTVSKEWFIINVVAAVFFYLAFVEVLYYFGVMEWVLKKLAWFFYYTMDISGAEAVVAAASPIVGQGDAACLVRPYMNSMTRSELHLVLASGYSTISGSFLSLYVLLGVPAPNLITSTIMSVPAVISISKMRCPETEEPVTRGNVIVSREGEKHKLDNALQAFFNGARFGLYIVGQIIANTLVFLSLLTLVNSLLTWIGLGFGVHQLTLQLIFGYIFYPFAFLIGIPHHELLPVARLLATKFVANELVAYTELQALMKTDGALSPRAYTITTFALCGFANMSSLAVTGVISALAPVKSTTVAKIAFSALLCGFLSTLQTAAIAAMLI
ncbi:Na+ dependent nucleoside transporter C-terminus-domain-containing protein [Rhodocollybia butyracea]|uniref:Na+ dependent nucleoside transporter C-terminus-domain-containing protein n=1 Tax=Rhodocollybia butyracea TaxID=206335 RepID=A0A9P5QAB8_9AGAR|nr:Na+ dependent nucleoside transporter C-terminus-domain-containing protein [Rhodocollybia butyracea]